MKYNRLVDPVQEFRAEDPPDFLHHRTLHRVIVRLRIRHAESEPFRIPDRLRARVGRHDQDRVPEVHLPPVRIRNMSLVEHLQQDIEDVRMRLLDLVEQYHAVRMAPHLLGELTALVIAHIAGRRAHQPGYIELLHILRHVDADDGILGAEDNVGKRLGQLRLSDAGRSKEEK